MRDAPDLPRVLHIDLERGWRGGQQQVAYLYRHLGELGISQALAALDGGALHAHAVRERWEGLAVPRLWPLSVPALARQVRQRRANVIHAHSSRSQDLGLALKLLCPRTRLVVSRRVDFHRQGGPINRWKYETPLVSRWIAVSRRVAEVLKEDGAPAGRVTTIYSGIDVERISSAALDPAERDVLRRKLGAEEGELIFGSVGALTPHKDHATLLHALALAKAEAPMIRLWIAGEGPERGELERLIAGLGLNRDARLLGWREDVPRLLHALDGFAMSSQEEGLGTSVLDAMAAGLPVIATAAGGIPEMIADGRNGYLVPRRNPAALAAALVSMARDPALRLACGRRNRQDVSEFTARRTAERTLDLYRSLVAG